MGLFDKHKKLINSLNKDNIIINDEHYNELDNLGYTVLKTDESFWEKNKINFNTIEKEYDHLCNLEGENGGWENRKFSEKIEPNAQRISNVPNKSPNYLKMVMLPDLLLAVNHIVKKPFKLSSQQLRNPIPFGNRQALHIDFRPRQFNYFNFNQCSVFVYLDDANTDNVALHIHPRTHKMTGEPSQEFVDSNKLKPKIIEVKKFNIVILNIYAWHYGGQNFNGHRRRTVFINYRERSEIQQLNQKKFIDKKIIEKMSDNEKYLFAVRKEDPTQSEFIYEYRHHYLIKKYFKIRDIFYHKYLQYKYYI